MNTRSQHRREIDQTHELKSLLAQNQPLSGWVLHGIDISSFDIQVDVHDTLLLGCTFKDRDQKIDLIERGAHVFPKFSNVPYQVYRHSLYTPEELLEGWTQGYTHTRDFKIYTHFTRATESSAGVGIREALAQRIHDHGIDDAIEHVLAQYTGPQRPGAIGIMGGHGVRRDDPCFEKVTRLTWQLAQHGYFIASGGGPGIMEAANLGAWLAPFQKPEAISLALEILKKAPRFDGEFPEGTPEYLQAISDYITQAYAVHETFFGPESEEVAQRLGRTQPQPGPSIAIPTWFYGHEPTNLFGTFIAKYFSNSIREDNLLAISTAGVVFAPGSAGTLQEVFMDLAQNHYATFHLRSPMVFLDTQTWEPLYKFIMNFVETRGMMDVYGDLIYLADDVDDAVQFILNHPPRPRPHTTPLYDLVKT